MHRLSLLYRSFSVTTRLQLFCVLLLVGWYIWIDFEAGKWPVSIGIILISFALARLMLPLMMRFSQITQFVWSTIGFAFLVTHFVARHEPWWNTWLAHFIREFVIWLALWCAYWFISEIQLQGVIDVTRLDADVEED